MGIANKDLNSAIAGLAQIMENNSLRPKFGYKILNLYRLLVNRFDDYAKYRNGQIEKLAERDEEGNLIFVDGTENVRISTENLAMIKELDESLVEGVTPVLLSELDANVNSLGIDVLVKLGNLLVDDASQNTL